MKWADLLLLSLQNLWRRKLRTILTIVGVMIGTASIVTMLSIGLGLNKQFTDEMMDNDNLMMITIYDYSARDTSARGSDQVSLDDKFIEKVAAIEHVDTVTPVLRLYPNNGTFELWQRKYRIPYLDITGIRRDAMEALGIPLIEGEFPKGGSSLKPLELFIGYDMKSNFQKERSNVYGEEPDIDWLGAKYEFRLSAWNEDLGQYGEYETAATYDARIVGISGIADGRNWSQYNYGAFADIDALKRLVKENARQFQGTVTDRYEQAYVKVDDYKNVERVMDAIKEGNTLQVNAEMEWINSIRRQAQSMQMVLGGIGSITMLVAAISIANTMLMSIYERTREIGVMKVLGCKLANISLLFLGEAGFIGLFGGIVGVGVSYGLSALLNFVFTYYGSSGFSGFGGAMQSYLPPWLAVMALVFSVIVGVISGFYPSQRAMRLSALAAIRNDV